jgi:nucleotide-binding universal stress UspA family protein
MSDEGSMGRIVVGVDGSEASKRALRWAAEEARLRSSSLEVVHTYEHDRTWTSYPGDEDVNPVAVEQLRREIARAADRAAAHAQAVVDRLIADLDGIDATATVVRSQHPAKTLLERSKGADMLVVGSRGRGGFKELLLGSIGQQCANYAECPVVIIRGTDGER